MQPLAAVQAGGLGFTQRPPQPGQRGVIESLLGQVAAKRRAERLPEPRVLLAADQVVPDRAEHAEVVGAGQLAFQRLGGRQLAAVPGHHLGHDRHRIKDRPGVAIAGARRPARFGRQSGALAVQPDGAVQFRRATAARGDVGQPGALRYAVGVVRFPAPAHRDIQALPAGQPVDQDVGGVGGAPERGVRGRGVGQTRVRGQIPLRHSERRRPPGLPGRRVAVQQAAHRDAVAAVPGGGGGDQQNIAVGQVPAVLPGRDLPVGAASGDQVPGTGGLARDEADLRAIGNAAVTDQVIAGAAGQLAGLVLGPGDQHGVQAGQVVGEPAAVRLLGGFLRGAAAQPPVLLVAGQHGDVAADSRWACQARDLAAGSVAQASASSVVTVSAPAASAKTANCPSSWPVPSSWKPRARRVASARTPAACTTSATANTTPPPASSSPPTRSST